MSALDRQEGGSHYKQWKIQPVEFIMANGLDYCTANILKYTMRFRQKGGKTDLDKARHYLDLLEESTYSEPASERDSKRAWAADVQAEMDAVA